MRLTITFARTAALILLLILSASPANADESDDWYVQNPTGEAAKNISQLMQAIIDGDAMALAEITSFPIRRQYPMTDIENAQDLEKYFNILFDDSIKTILKQATLKDWDMVGWRGYMLYHGTYFWTTEEGILYSITYESETYKAYIEQLRKENYQDLDESTEWETVDCFLAMDSSLFLRLETWDGVQRLHLLTHDENVFDRHLVFNGTREFEGSCHNAVYWYACADSVITILVTSPRCMDMHEAAVIADHLALFPDHYNLPDWLQGKTIPLQRAYWRDVKWWWNK